MNTLKHFFTSELDWWLVCCGLMSHSAIFQLYSDGTVVQFFKYWPAAGHTTPWAAKGFLACRAFPDTSIGTSEDVFNLLAIRGPTRVEGKPGIKPGSSDPQSSPLPLCHRGRANWIEVYIRFIHWFVTLIYILPLRT